MTTIAVTHTARCIESARVLIHDNNLDTLVERGLNGRTAGLDRKQAGDLIDRELEAGYTEDTLLRPTEAAAIEWLASGIADCTDVDRCGR